MRKRFNWEQREIEKKGKREIEGEMVRETDIERKRE